MVRAETKRNKSEVAMSLRIQSSSTWENKHADEGWVYRAFVKRAVTDVYSKVVNRLCKAVCGLFSVTMNFTRINKSRIKGRLMMPARIRSSMIYKLLSTDCEFDEIQSKWNRKDYL